MWRDGSTWPTRSPRPVGSPTNRVVILRAEGRGFCAGVDIKEINAKGDEALVGVNRGCAAAFAAVYDCEVPVIAAVQGFCLGGGIGLAGNADMVVASDDATFGLPEVDRGALGAATHLARLVPQHAMRKMVYTAKPISAAELASYGSVAAVVPPGDLHAAALPLAAEIATKSPTHHPAGQGVAQRHRPRRREAQLPVRAGLHLRAPRPRRGRRAARPPSSRSATPTPRHDRRDHMSDKRTTVDDIVGELRSGMTIGIGGWGSRRKPMAVVRALCRSDLNDLTVVAYGGPDVGLLCATGKVRKVVCGFVTLDSIALDPHWRAARQQGRVEVMEVDEGMFFQGLQAAAWRVPFLPTRAGLGSDVLTVNPDLRLVRSPYGADSPFIDDPADADVELVAMPALHLDAAIIHTNRADRPATARSSGPTPSSTRSSSVRPSVASSPPSASWQNGTLDRRGPLITVAIHRMMTDGVAETPGGAHFTANPPDYGRDEAFQKEYAASAGRPAEWEAFASATST